MNVMTTKINPRETRGLTIVQTVNQVSCVEDNFCLVQSQSGNGEYAVLMVE